VAVRSKARVCGRSISEIAGSNPTESRDVCLSSLTCCVGAGLCAGLITPSEKSY